MRVQIRIPPEVWTQLCLVAEAEHRPPKYQIELLLWDAIAQAAQAQDRQLQPQEVLCATE
jgi:hypothetical protein